MPGLIFLRFAAQRAKLEKAGASSRRDSGVKEPADHQAEGFMCFSAKARSDYLLIACIRAGVLPNVALLEQFEQVAVQIRDSVLNLCDKILSRTRDPLLPRRLSGLLELKTEAA